ncbi:MAG: DNA topoisomerase III, partial [Clostridia bacterium]|nr:DNA topoisomerase III [Clostridia bacterium]
MSKKLIIAEKPSLARNIASAIRPSPKPVSADKKSRSVYYENDSFIIAYAFGHLLSLADAEEYSPDYKAWRSDVLPIVPEKFKYTIRKDRGNQSQYTLLRKLIERDDVDAIVNAGDSDREGEIIIRNIITHTGTKKPVFRLWMPDQTPRTIASELAGMSPDSEYDRLACEGYARTYIDWLYGINLSRMATLKSGRLLRVGRVTSPIVSAICERERLIRNFVPEKYYVALSDDKKTGLKLLSKKKFDNEKECAELCRLYNESPTFVTGRKTERKIIPRPRLYALSDLQGEAGRAFGYSPKRTLDILQKLYEDGLVTYPRTNSQYMATAEKKKASDIIDAIHRAYPGPFDGVVFRDSKYIFDASKIEAHSGLTPTYKIPDVNSMQKDEKNIYRMVFMRFCSVFCKEDYTVHRTTLTIDNGHEKFTLTGDVTVTSGFTRFEQLFRFR